MFGSREPFFTLFFLLFVHRDGNAETLPPSAGAAINYVVRTPCARGSDKGFVLPGTKDAAHFDFSR